MSRGVARTGARETLARAAAALAAGDCADPFAVLGPHGRAAGTEVRIYQPGASAVALTDGNGRELARAEERRPGFFVAALPRPDYRVRVAWPGGQSVFDDAYRFGLVLGDLDVHLLSEGTHRELHRCLGAHPRVIDGVRGTSFAVWAPNARRVSVVGDFNGWDGRRLPMRLRHACGVWELFVPQVREGALYKFEIRSARGDLLPLKADPVGFAAERRPATASRVFDLGRLPAAEADAEWRAARTRANAYDRPIAVYEVHLGSWRRVPESGARPLTYDELARDLVDYAKDMGFSHIELLPVTEHPFDGSWGYQPLGLYAPTSRFGAPDGFARLVARAHAEGIGVICDWVPAHFPTDPHGLGLFDGTHLYEHADPRQGFHPDWNTLIYNFGRREVTNFLMANAMFWLRRYGIDALRVDAVASMLYLDYSRERGEWVPNRYGGRENLEAVDFLRRLNELVFGEVAGATTIAEESTAWPGVSRPVYAGGLGFGYKWNMGWMHDTLEYMRHEPVHRRWHHHQMTFGLHYAFSENFILPLSHDEVVHGKGSLIGKMPGDTWQRFANLRAYYGFMYGHPGKKLLFMGGEFAQWREWNHDESLDWHLLGESAHRGVQNLVRDLNRCYRDTPALYRRDCRADGFQWVAGDDFEQSTFAFLRHGEAGDRPVLVVSNFTPVARHGYRLGVPRAGAWREILNSDAAAYGGSNVGNAGGVSTQPVASHGHGQSLVLTLPPLATVYLEHEPAS